jgi:L-Ala-D/L-Glu epimerase
MKLPSISPMTVHAQVEQWPLAEPFRITGYTFETIEVLSVSLERDGCVGRGEAAGVYYKDDKPPAMLRQVEAVRSLLEPGITRKRLQEILPAGGARNAVDCALWDLEAKLTATPAWQIAGLDLCRPILTTFTCGADEPEIMARRARGYSHARALKLKLTGEEIDAARVRAVRAARPEVWLGVDANQGFTRDSLERLMPVLVENKVALIEQPFAIGQEILLEGFQSPIPIAADESVQTLDDLPLLVGRFDMINIKLDKCGGLTEGLAMARAAREFGFDAMVGNMIGTSLAMAPACVVGQLCNVADLDGVVFLKEDRSPNVSYADGHITCPPGLWG